MKVTHNKSSSFGGSKSANSVLGRWKQHIEGHQPGICGTEEGKRAVILDVCESKKLTKSIGLA